MGNELQPIREHRKVKTRTTQDNFKQFIPELGITITHRTAELLAKAIDRFLTNHAEQMRILRTSRGY